MDTPIRKILSQKIKLPNGNYIAIWYYRAANKEYVFEVKNSNGEVDEYKQAPVDKRTGVWMPHGAPRRLINKIKRTGLQIAIYLQINLDSTLLFNIKCYHQNWDAGYFYELVKKPETPVVAQPETSVKTAIYGNHNHPFPMAALLSLMNDTKEDRYRIVFDDGKNKVEFHWSKCLK